MSDGEDDTKEKIHDHAEEIENSRPPSNLTRRSSSNLGPVRTGRASVASDGVSQRLSSAPTTEAPVYDIPRKSPLPPIGAENAEQPVLSSESDVEIPIAPENPQKRTGNENTYRPNRKRHPKILKGYRSESWEPHEGQINKSENKGGDQMVLKYDDGRERVLISIECQTEWSWMEDMRRLQGSTKQSRYSILTSGHEADADDTDDDEEEEELETREPIKEEKSKVTPKEKDKLSQPSTKSIGGKTDNTSLKSGEQSSVQAAPSLRDDDYGIPILELSTDSSSDEESVGEAQGTDLATEAQDVLGTLPSIGPPQILQYNRESEKKELDPGEPDDLDPEIITKLENAKNRSSEGGIFQGTCEFCGGSIKKFPSMDEQKSLPPEQLYCCDEYRQFVQFMVSHPLHEKFNLDKLIDITPHAPYGSKQARKAAKERAAQRMRERELARQQAAIASGAMGGTGGPSNFYQVARQMKTINYCLSSQKCLEEGWTLRPPSPLLEGDQDVDVFEPQPVLPPWADPQKSHQLYHSGCIHKYKPHYHDIFYQPPDALTLVDRGLVRKFYPDGNKFVILFPDGTGNVFYPSGRVAISIVSLKEREGGLYSYIVTDDTETANVLAVFEHNGSGVSYYQHHAIRVCLDQLGGVELDAYGAKKRKWSWKDQVQHVHAPPIQPITFAVNSQVAVRIMSQSNITLTFTAGKRSARFQVGSQLKLVAPQNVPEPEIDDDELFRNEVRNRIQELLLRVNNLLKFPKSPKLDKLPNPPHLALKQQKIEKLRTLKREKTVSKDKKNQSPVVVVN